MIGQFAGIPGAMQSPFTDGRRVGVLGNTTRSATLAENKVKTKGKGAVAGRWGMLRTVKKYIPGHENARGVRVPDSPFYCMTLQPRGTGGTGGNVSVFRKTGDGGGAFYSGLYHCGSVWGCPVCAPRIAEVRCTEVCEAMDRHYAAGGYCLLVTFTFPHCRGGDLRANVDKFLGAVRRFKSGATWQGIKKDLNLIGSIRGLEVTYWNPDSGRANNGFHPHTHELLFVRAVTATTDAVTGTRTYPEIDAWREIFADRWRKFAAEFGLGLTNSHGLDMRVTSSSDYVAKFGELARWGGDRELVKGTAKTRGGLSPWELLRRAASDPEYGRIWQEYYRAFKGRRQLYWTRGLREIVFPELREKTNQECAREIPDGYELAGTLSPGEWVFLGVMDLHEDFLSLVAVEGFDVARGVCFRSRPPP